MEEGTDELLFCLEVFIKELRSLRQAEFHRRCPVWAVYFLDFQPLLVSPPLPPGPPATNNTEDHDDSGLPTPEMESRSKWSIQRGKSALLSCTPSFMRRGLQEFPLVILAVAETTNVKRQARVHASTCISLADFWNPQTLEGPVTGLGCWGHCDQAVEVFDQRRKAVGVLDLTLTLVCYGPRDTATRHADPVHFHLPTPTNHKDEEEGGRVKDRDGSGVRCSHEGSPPWSPIARCHDHHQDHYHYDDDDAVLVHPPKLESPGVHEGQHAVVTVIDQPPLPSAGDPPPLFYYSRHHHHHHHPQEPHNDESPMALPLSPPRHNPHSHRPPWYPSSPTPISLGKNR